jgi:LacI family transcriptional regulator
MSKETSPKQKRLQKKPLYNPTLQDVAKHAGVSTATVSRFLANAQQVGEERRRRIEASIAALEYIPHGAAQALASQRSRTIGTIVPTLDNAIFAKGIQAFQQRLQDAGYTLFIASSNYSHDEERTQAETLIMRGVDGMMLIGLDHHDLLFERLKQKQMPYINTWSFRSDSDHPCIGFNNFDAAVRLTTYMLDIGHTRFGIISGITRDNDRAHDRLQGILRTLSERGLTVPDNMLSECPYDIAASRQAMKRLLDSAEPPTAVICGNDVLAYGALLECQASGHTVPDDVSITGFDDLPMSHHIQPPLTTMHVPSEEMGQKAADYLLACLNGESLPEHTELEVNLIIRSTTAPPHK